MAPVQSGFKKLDQIITRVRDFARRDWRRALRIREKLWFSEEALHLVLAGGVGVIGGLVNLAFHDCIEWAQLLFLHRTGEPAELAAGSIWQVRLLVPTVGGLVAGAVLYWGLRLVGKQGSSNILEVVATSDGRLPFRSAMVKAISSLMSIGCGASIGREGAITQLAAMFGSKCAKQLLQPVSMSVAPSTDMAVMPVLPLNVRPARTEPPEASRPVVVSITPGRIFR